MFVFSIKFGCTEGHKEYYVSFGLSRKLTCSHAGAFIIEVNVFCSGFLTKGG
jgi:hypothetical protein